MNDGARGNTNGHGRRSIRLKGYDYSQPGAYFVTICTQNRECLFGEIEHGVMRLNAMGEMVKFTWDDRVHHVAGIALGPFAVMPNHVHGIIEIVVGAGPGPARTEPARTEPARAIPVGAGSEPAPTAPTGTGTGTTVALSEIVRQFKTFSARRVNTLRNAQGVAVWQRNYWEHIIRDEKSYEQIAAYILNNPRQWEEDQLYTGDAT